MSILSLFGQASSYDSSTYDYGSSGSYSSTNISPEAAAGIAAATLLFILVTAAVAYVVTALCLGRIFKKAGVEQWKAWVPVYNSWVMLELGDQQGFWAVLALIPIVNIVAGIFMIIAMYHIGLKLGKPGAFVLLAIFLTPVWLIWLAVDNSKWQGQEAVAATSGAQPPAPTPPQASSTPTPPSSDDSNQSTPPAAS